MTPNPASIMDLVKKRYPTLKAPESKIVRLTVSSSDDCVVVTAEDEFQNALWQSFELSFSIALSRLYKERQQIPGKEVPVYFYPNAQRELRNCLIAVFMAQKLDKLNCHLQDDNLALNLAVELGQQPAA